MQVHNSTNKRWRGNLRWQYYSHHSKQPSHSWVWLVPTHQNMETQPWSQQSQPPQSWQTTWKPWEDQCHLWSPKLTQNTSLVPCISGMSTKRNIHWRCLQSKLRNMAKTNGDTHQPLLPQLEQDSKGALKGPMPRHSIYKAKSIGENYRKWDSQDQDQGQKITFSSHPTHLNPWSLLPHKGPLQLDPHWPNGSLTIHFPTRQQIYHGGNPPWCKLHYYWTYA